MEFIPGIQGWLNILKLINIIHHINMLKNKNSIIISKDSDVALDKIQLPFRITILSKSGTEGTLLNIGKAI